MDPFLLQIIESVKSFGGLSFILKISALIALVISSTKVSYLSKYWQKLGSFQAVVAPTLGLISGILILSTQGQLTFSGVCSYIFAGSGAIILHEWLDGVKSIPGLGVGYVAVIDFVSAKLGGQVAVK